MKTSIKNAAAFDRFKDFIEHRNKYIENILHKHCKGLKPDEIKTRGDIVFYPHNLTSEFYWDQKLIIKSRLVIKSNYAAWKYEEF
jgi:hypothetical protein